MFTPAAGIYLHGALTEAGLMQIKKNTRVSVAQSKADRVLNYLISFLVLLVFIGMAVLLHVSIVAAEPHGKTGSKSEQRAHLHQFRSAKGRASEPLTPFSS